MNEKFPKLLAGFEVFADWRERVDRSQHCAFSAFTTALATVAIAVVLLGIHWISRPDDLLAVEAVWFFLFAVGGWCITRSPISRLYRYLLVAAVATLLLLAVLLMGSSSQAERATEASWWRLGTLLIPLVVLWGGVARFTLRDCQESPFCLLSLRWRPKALLYGIGVGSLLYIQIFLAHTFVGGSLPVQSLDRLGMAGWFGTTILIGAVAEELLFRATIFDYLHKVRGINLWIAVIVSVGINLIFYLPQAPMAAPLAQQTLFWLAPIMLSITNALLWTWERGVNSVVASNVMFRILHALLR